MYVYSSGIIEYFHGMIPLRDYVYLMEKYKNDVIETDSFYLTEKELQNFLAKAFMSVFVYGQVWQGDISGDNVCISALPRPHEEKPYKILAFRQLDAGISFIVSEGAIDNYFGCLKEKMDGQVDVIEAFEKSMDLATKLIEKYAKKEVEIVRPKLVAPIEKPASNFVPPSMPDVEWNNIKRVKEEPSYLKDFVRL